MNPRMENIIIFRVIENYYGQIRQSSYSGIPCTTRNTCCTEWGAFRQIIIMLNIHLDD